jgi:cofilin
MFAPDTAKMTVRMIYATTKDSFKKKLDGIAREFQVNDYDDLSMDLLKDAFAS